MNKTNSVNKDHLVFDNMRAFKADWRNRLIVQRSIAQIPDLPSVREIEEALGSPKPHTSKKGVEK